MRYDNRQCSEPASDQGCWWQFCFSMSHRPFSTITLFLLAVTSISISLSYEQANFTGSLDSNLIFPGSVSYESSGFQYYSNFLEMTNPNAVVPFTTVIVATFVGMYVDGIDALGGTGISATLSHAFAHCDSVSALIWASAFGWICVLVPLFSPFACGAG